MTLLEPIEERSGKGRPELSVLMPVCNTERLVGAAVASVLQQRGCIAEILISDDQSSDGTLAAVRQAVAQWRGPHHVRILRSSRRLAIDHIGALVSLAAAPFLVQAHGDDISLPDRLATLLAIHRDTGAALVTTLARSSDRAGVHDEPIPRGWAEGWLPLSAFAARNPFGILAGARQALDRRVFELFPRLDSSYLRLGHDALQAFRAWLLGGVWFCPERLLVRAHRLEQWSNRLWDTRLPASREFGFCLHRLAVMRAVLRDLAYAAEHRTVPAARIQEARAIVIAGSRQLLRKLVKAHDELLRLGLTPLWVTEAVLEEANREREPAPAGDFPFTG